LKQLTASDDHRGFQSRRVHPDLVSRRADDRHIDDPTTLLSYDDALAVIARLGDVARSRGEVLRSPIVLVGGTALAGWQIRAYSRDVDIYVPEISADAVELVEQDHDHDSRRVDRRAARRCRQREV
jgi:hypothetical protein